MEYRVHETADELAGAAGSLIADEIAGHEQLLLGLAGGSTPRATYGRLAEMDIDWNGVTTWMTDERWVLPDDPDSNQAMVRESLDTIGRIRFLAPNTRLEYPSASARRMTRSMGCLMNRQPRRSVTMLGMGDDGHTASLFPGSAALSVTGSSYVANWVSHLDTWRLTASFGLLSTSDVVGAGADKSVQVLDEGASARRIYNIDTGPIRSVVVGIVDDIHESTDEA